MPRSAASGLTICIPTSTALTTAARRWQLITNGLPDDAPVDTVREDPVRRGLLFAGTETAVWVSFDDGDHWQSLQLNLPHTSMRDLWIHENDLIVATHGRSFWMLDDITPLRQLTEPVARSEAYLFQPAPACRVRRSTYPDTPIPPDEPAAENPPDGAILDYFLAQPASGPVTLEILNAKGKLVRRYSSTDQPDVTQADLEKQSIPLYWIRMPKILPATAGMHRWVWDLRYPAPDSLRHEYPISAVPHDTPRLPLGPAVLPGTYTVRLTVKGRSSTALLIVRMDPRVNTPPAGLEQQSKLEMGLSSLLTRSSQALTEARSVREQLQKISSQASGLLAESIKALDQKVSVVLGKPAPMLGAVTPEISLSRLNSQVGTLYGEVDQVDATPTTPQTEASAGVERDLSAVMKQWDELKRADLAALNRRLHDANLPEVRVPPRLRPSGEDEDD